MTASETSVVIAESDTSIAPVDTLEVGSNAEGMTRRDVDCSAEALGSDDELTIDTAHYVVNGRLGAVCLGTEDDRLIDAWNDLATIAPETALADLGVFASFSSLDDASDEVALAFVNELDADGTLFQMSVDVALADGDADEALLTLAHEFSHVFTLLPSQLDRTFEAAETCTTYDSGDGCFAPDSLIVDWIDAFWGDHLDGLDATDEPTVADGERRCRDDAGFFGPYAASDPEEDFAETFSAYVFDVPAATPEQQRRLDWMADQPGLAEFRLRADAAGLTPLANEFDVCGIDS